ncbi:PcfJ domain-containing protein [Flavobacterium sp. UGB4466]|uniref:PcfJ domain-containing protein n=1 Tax=Flavobacterium sp. UGB4466 TaxID=2730889 RepID=UPI00192B9AD4|nr:PcfJ domain-containing protein [Flavobacterium sp. UGB4466]
MIPKTNLEKQLTALSASLPKIKPKVHVWAEKNIFLKWGVLSRSKFYCLECAHVWKPTDPNTCSKFTACTACKAKLKIQSYNHVYFKELEYSAVVQTYGGFQVIRIICSQKHMKKNCAPTYSHSEVMQHWISPEGEVRTLSMSVNVFAHACDAWKLYSSLEIRPKDFSHNAKYRINPYKVYPNAKVLPILKRNGFKASVHSIAPQILFTALLKDSIAETLLKAKQFSLLQYYLGASRQNIKRNWQAVKTVIKNGYLISDITIWEDYIELLQYFEKDLNSALYVCPTSLNEAHDLLVCRKRELRRKKKLQDLRLEIEKAQDRYTSDKKRFFGLVFRQNELSITVIENVRDFMQEGDDLGHCVFTNEYYSRKDSLILSAKVDGQSVETIEISLNHMEILQCRGLKNKPSKHHKIILSLIKKNLYQIRSRIKNKK